MRLADYPRSQQKAIKRLFKEMALSGHYVSPNRAKRRWADCDPELNAWARRTLDLYSCNGKIGIIRSGMDCDCCQYYAESIMPVDGTVAGFLRWYHAHNDSLDGPESMRFLQPELIKPVYRSRDRALEAYEDGHPSVVRYTPGDDLSY